VLERRDTRPVAALADALAIDAHARSLAQALLATSDSPKTFIAARAAPPDTLAPLSPDL